MRMTCASSQLATGGSFNMTTQDQAFLKGFSLAARRVQSRRIALVHLEILQSMRPGQRLSCIAKGLEAGLLAATAVTRMCM